MLLMILFLLNFHYNHSEMCPPPIDIKPCFCTTTGSDISAQCSNLESLEQLVNTVNGFYGREIHSMAITDSRFEYIPYDIFENVTIKELSIIKSNFSRIGQLGDPQFKGLESSLEILKFHKAFTKSNPLTYVSLGHLKHLEILEFRDSYVKAIHNEWFKKGPKSLKVVRFIKGDIRVIGYNAFNSLTNLRILDLSENELTFIPRWALPEPAQSLTELNLERNKLETLPDDIFTAMPSLEQVNLELNEFSTIDETVWSLVWDSLEYLNIDYNPLICDRKIKWIYDKRMKLEGQFIATCYQPFNLMDRELISLKPDELK